MLLVQQFMTDGWRLWFAMAAFGMIASINTWLEPWHTISDGLSDQRPTNMYSHDKSGALVLWSLAHMATGA